LSKETIQLKFVFSPCVCLVTNTTYKHYKHVLLKIVGVERISLDHADFVYPSPCVVFDVLAPPLGKE
jgi:hypothetical protein